MNIWQFLGFVVPTEQSVWPNLSFQMSRMLRMIVEAYKILKVLFKNF